MQGHDVGVLQALQEVHLPLDGLPPHPAPAPPAHALLDELCRKVQTCAFLPAPLHDGKLPAGQETEGQREREAEGHRERGRQRDRERETEGQREGGRGTFLIGALTYSPVLKGGISNDERDK